MKRTAPMVALLLLFTHASATESWRVGNRLIREGDGVGRLITLAGQPDLRERLETRFGGAAGYRWHYIRIGYNAKTIVVTIRNGRIVDIEMDRH